MVYQEESISLKLHHKLAESKLLRIPPELSAPGFFFLPSMRDLLVNTRHLFFNKGLKNRFLTGIL